MNNLSKHYDPKQVEDKIYSFWEKGGYFSPNKSAKKFVIAIPPPNITGSLHMGHALNNTVQDILIRRARMMGLETLWVPGTDHAGIAAQNVVEKKLRKTGKTRHDLGREKFIQQVWKWKKEFGGIIINQLKKLGCSCDWQRERFTMDDNYSQAVNFAFKHYFDKGYIYKGKRVINWCPRCQTALSDLENVHKEERGKLYFIKYLLTENPALPASRRKRKMENCIVAATTRPETMLGDTAIAVNPKDKRYQKLIGKNVVLPLINKQIPIISDLLIDAKFATGAVKITPAHDLIDEQIAKNHNLTGDNVIDKFGKILDLDFIPKKYHGLKITDAREKIVDDLENLGLIEKIENYSHSVGHCERCDRITEYLISEQWFLKMSELVKPAIKVVEDGKIKFYPARWKKVYLDWLKNIKDWCISRQLWWGHQLPVWFRKNQTEKIFNFPTFSAGRQFSIYKQTQNTRSKNSNPAIYVGDNPPKTYIQETDVLDTWFSSALWPFAVFGWPKKTIDLEKYFPTTTLSTARDILYLWVARMVFSSLEFTGNIPFSEVYIHPTIFNKDGKRMSKSLGTGVDPLDLIEKYGTDAVRFGLSYQNTGTQDIKFSEDTILSAKKFANKIFNASKFVITNIDCLPAGKAGHAAFHAARNDNTKADKEILTKLKNTQKNVDKYLNLYQFGQASHCLYDFFWHDFCDTYLEASKIQLADDKLRTNTQIILLKTLTDCLKLLHPFMPFITEEIWQTLRQYKLVKEKALIIARWPEAN